MMQDQVGSFLSGSEWSIVCMTQVHTSSQSCKWVPSQSVQGYAPLSPFEDDANVCSQPVNHLVGNLYEITTIPVPGFAFQVHGSTVEDISR